MATFRVYCKISYVALFLLILLAASPLTAHAVGFALQSTSEGDTAFARSYQYFFGVGGQNPLTNGTNWTATLTDTAAGATHNLTVDIKHINGLGVPPQGPPFSFTLNGLITPPTGKVSVVGRAEMLNHGTGTDIARASVNIFANKPGIVEVSGQHFAAQPTNQLFKPSLKNTSGVTLSGWSIVPSYREAGTNTIFFDKKQTQQGTNLSNGGGAPTYPFNQTAMNPDTNNIGILADYKVTAVGSGKTETTMAFVGDVDGYLSELDLVPAMSAFGFDEFVVPLMRRQNESDLFVAVDLVQWLSSDMLFSPAQIFDVANGLNPDLPGFLFSTSEISFVPGTGFVIDSAMLLNNESIYVAGTIDGSYVPEPSTLLLLSTGLVGIVVIGRKRRFRKH